MGREDDVVAGTTHDVCAVLAGEMSGRLGRWLPIGSLQSGSAGALSYFIEYEMSLSPSRGQPSTTAFILAKWGN
jgi:hypothetical protein